MTFIKDRAKKSTTVISGKDAGLAGHVAQSGEKRESGVLNKLSDIYKIFRCFKSSCFSNAWQASYHCF